MSKQQSEYDDQSQDRRAASGGLFALGAMMGALLGFAVGCSFTMTTTYFDFEHVVVPPFLGGVVIGPTIGVAIVWIVSRFVGPGETD